MCVLRALEWSECLGTLGYARFPPSVTQHHRAMLKIIFLTLMEMPGGPCGPGKPGKPGGPATPGTPGCPFCPCNNKKERGERDVGSLTAPIAALSVPQRPKGSAHRGYNTHRGARLPVSAGNHLHSSQDIARFALCARRGGHTFNCAGMSRQKQAVLWFRGNKQTLNQAAPERHAPLYTAKPNHLVPETLLEVLETTRLCHEFCSLARQKINPGEKKGGWLSAGSVLWSRAQCSHTDILGPCKEGGETCIWGWWMDRRTAPRNCLQLVLSLIFLCPKSEQTNFFTGETLQNAEWRNLFLKKNEKYQGSVIITEQFSPQRL